MGITETLQIDEMLKDFNRMNKRQVSFSTSLAVVVLLDLRGLTDKMPT